MQDIRTLPVGQPYWCPCCGGVAKVKSYPDATWTGPLAFHGVHCVRCGLQTKDYQTPHEAVAAWNRRKHDD